MKTGEKSLTIVLILVLVIISAAVCLPKFLENDETDVKTESVNVIIMGTEHHDSDKDRDICTYSRGNLTEWYNSEVELREGSSAVAALDKAAENAEMTYTVTEGFIEEINGLFTGANGSQSGWLFMINGEYPPKGIEEQVVNEGDEIIFCYTDNYMYEMES